jgi:hypothetical protein
MAFRKYHVSDGTGEIEIRARSARHAGELFASGFEPEAKTFWVSVTATRISTGQTFRVKAEVPPRCPDCAEGRDHRWIAGDERGSGGGVVHTYRCPDCGRGKVVNTWDYDPADGEQGLTSVAYTEPEPDDDDGGGYDD